VLSLHACSMSDVCTCPQQRQVLSCVLDCSSCCYACFVQAGVASTTATQEAFEEAVGVLLLLLMRADWHPVTELPHPLVSSTINLMMLQHGTECVATAVQTSQTMLANLSKRMLWCMRCVCVLQGRQRLG
jgi:hypothetical protein